MEQNISPVVVPLDAHLEELKERSVLRDELVRPNKIRLLLFDRLLSNTDS
jgi:hypothetical protein